jgi:hypothetical protein
MEKVRINQTVANWIETSKEHILKNLKSKEFEKVNKTTLARVLTLYTVNELEQQNIDIVTLAKAIQYGYEIPYEIKENDIIVSLVTRNFYEVTEIVGSNGYRSKPQVGNGIFFIEKNKAKLVCKAEERHDLKEVGK